MRPARILRCSASLAVLAFPAFAAPDEEQLGQGGGYPIGTRGNWFYDESVRVGSFSNLDKLLPHYTLRKLRSPLPLPAAAGEPKFDYRFENQALDARRFSRAPARHRPAGDQGRRDPVRALSVRSQTGGSLCFAFDGEIHRQHRGRDGACRRKNRLAGRCGLQIRAEACRQSVWGDLDTQCPENVVRRAVQRSL